MGIYCSCSSCLAMIMVVVGSSGWNGENDSLLYRFRGFCSCCRGFLGTGCRLSGRFRVLSDGDGYSRLIRFFRGRPVWLVLWTVCEWLCPMVISCIVSSGCFCLYLVSICSWGPSASQASSSSIRVYLSMYISVYIL